MTAIDASQQLIGLRRCLDYAADSGDKDWRNQLAAAEKTIEWVAKNREGLRLLASVVGRMDDLQSLIFPNQQSDLLGEAPVATPTPVGDGVAQGIPPVAKAATKAVATRPAPLTPAARAFQAQSGRPQPSQERYATGEPPRQPELGSQPPPDPAAVVEASKRRKKQDVPEAFKAELTELMQHPAVIEVLSTFVRSRIVDVKKILEDTTPNTSSHLHESTAIEDQDVPEHDLEREHEAA